MSVDVSLAAEFPNDNPALHGGVIWVCLEPTGPAVAELVTRPPSRPVEERAPVVDTLATSSEHDEAAAPTVVDVVEPGEDEILIEELAPLDEVVETVGVIPAFDSVPPPSTALESAPPPASDDPFALLVCTLADVAIGAGSPHVASLLPGLLFDGRLPDMLDDAAAEVLRTGGFSAVTTAQSTRSSLRSSQRRPRGAILRGQSDDFSACPSMLDEWTSTLLARLLGAEAPRMRQELRSRGVAAFGMA